ncbi:MAG: hypothetical protein JRK53_15660 [Deltaproteobacteria bacterium]|nr:hypothetical protein [Deltaproteobacteria bacterium]MBW1816323.1 hypothetical protein [Deltaproteobacteria bacterium]MBW2284933.1 hypothetical protein [Deltaproteobacteria bacterium]
MGTAHGTFEPAGCALNRSLDCLNLVAVARHLASAFFVFDTIGDIEDFFHWNGRLACRSSSPMGPTVRFFIHHTMKKLSINVSMDG